MKLNKIVNLLPLIFLLIFASALVKNIQRSIQARKEVDKVRTRVENLRKENEELEKKLTQSQSEEFIEKQIRDKLGLVKEGEIVLIMPDAETLRKLAPDLSAEEEILPPPNWKRWLRLFE